MARRIYSPPHPRRLKLTDSGCYYGGSIGDSVMPCDETYRGTSSDGGTCSYTFVSTKRAHFSRRFPVLASFDKLMKISGLRYVTRRCTRLGARG